MGQVRLYNLPSNTVWRDDDPPPPLVNDTPPVVPEDDAPAPARRPLLLLWLGVITCVYIGARAIGVLVNWHPVATPVCVAGWLLACGLAIFREWRIAR